MPSQAEIDLIVNAARALPQLQADLIRIVNEAERSAPTINLQVQVDKDKSLANATSLLGSVTSGLGKLGAGIGLAGAAAGTAAPLLAGVVAAVENLAPAAAVATTGILAMQLATQTLKLGFMGVGEAIQEAFKPDADMAKVNEQLKELAPSARATALEIIGLKDEFKALQQGVQQRLFAGFASEIKDLSTTVLPDLQSALNRTAVTLNEMGKGVSTAAQDLASGGVLSQALGSANAGLEDLVRLPGQAVTAFGELAAAAGPSFERITTAVAGVADRVSESLTGAFKSGALQDAIEEAIDSVAQLGRIAGNVFGGLGNIITAVSVDGQGLFGTLEMLTQGFQDITGTQEFQDGLGALAETMALLYKTAGPLLGEAIKTVGKVLVELSEPAQTLIELLGGELGKIFEQLSPVLVELAGTVGKLVGALSPLIELAGDLIVALLPSLTPLLETLGIVFEEMTPFIAEVARIIGSVLGPALEKLPGFLEIILEPLNQFAKEIFPILVEQLEKMAPDFEDLGTSIGKVLEDLAPVVAEFLNLILLIDGQIIPIISGALIGTLALLAKGLKLVFDAFDTFLIPSIQFWIDLLQGDFQDGNVAAWTNVFKLRDNVILAFNQIVSKVTTALSDFSSAVNRKVNETAADFQADIQSMVDDAVDYIGSLPGRAADSIGAQANALYSAGSNLIQGFIDGIQSKIAEVASVLTDLTSKIPDWKGPAELDLRLLTPSGEMVMDGFIAGIRKAVPRVRAEFQGLTAALPSFAPAPSAVSAPAAGAMAVPNIAVYVGGERFDQYVTVRAEQVYNENARTAAQGVRI